jgi:hypothetical protein
MRYDAFFKLFKEILPAAISLRATTMSSFLGEETRYSEPSRICRTLLAARCTSKKRLFICFKQSSIVIRANDASPKNLFYLKVVKN